MAARKNKNQINLLAQDEFEGSTMGRILLWALSTFRIIVIATEMVVMIAFLSRFWLDARNVDLNDLIKQKQAVLAETSDFEKEFRGIQKKLKIFSALSTDERPITGYLTTISSYLPADTSLASYSYSGGTIQVKGKAISEAGIAQFIINLTDSGSFNTVEMINLDSSVQEASLLTFTLRIIPKGKG
jgi:Tfp pilus assembly protein PilN